MNTVSAGHTYDIGQPFDKALKTIRGVLAEMEMGIVGEFDMSGTGSQAEPARSRVLLVDCPLLDFEALALDRASAVFFPLHILVSAIGERTRASVLNPGKLFDARLPAGAAEPVSRMQARVAMALESAVRRPEDNQH